MMKFPTVLLILLASESVNAAITADLIESLPGLSFSPKFKQYSGYLKASESVFLHYWFVESQGNPAKDPVVLWLNGGPGCSSLDGLLYENGPMKVTDDGKTLNKNNYAWNKIANVLYLEAPAGVGFSYTTNTSYTPTDDLTAKDNYMALKFFFQNYPEFSNNDFYVTGESYGGIYVPTLSNIIIQDSKINFKGFAVGNGLSSSYLNQNSLIYFANYHGLIGKELWDKMVNKCCKNNNESDCDFVNVPTVECDSLVQTVSRVMSGLNIYNLYAECYVGKNSNGKQIPSLFHPKYHYFPQTIQTKQEYKTLLSYPSKMVSLVPPCINADGITIYLNQKSVRDALHIPSHIKEWSICSNVGYISQYDDMKKQYLNVLSSKKYKIMVYNGDVDMACNYLGDEWFVNSLHQKQTDNWRSYSYHAKDGSTQIAGYFKKYENLVFVTVKGSGHMVPQDKPAPAFVLFERFLKGTF